MNWTAPAAQIWHAEAILLVCLFLKLATRKTNLPYFEGLIACSAIFDVSGLVVARLGHLDVYTNISYLSFLVETPLMALACSEAADHKPTYHRAILYWWIAATVACLGIRYFPWSGRALLICNIVAYIFWLRKI